MNTIWVAILSGVSGTMVSAALTAVWRSLRNRMNSLHGRFDKIEQHLVKQDIRIARIEGKVGVGD